MSACTKAGSGPSSPPAPRSDAARQPGRSRVVHGIFRTAGVSLAAFAVLNAVGDLLVDGFGVDFVWIRFPDALAAPGRIALLGAAVAMAWSAFRPVRDRRRALACEALLVIVALAALWNALGFWRLVLDGDVSTRFPVPSSLAVLAVLVANGVRLWAEHVRGERIDAADGPLRLTAVHGASFAGVAVGGPLLLLFACGSTDYSPMVGGEREPADCIVVYGAKVYADGAPSLALSDRVAEGVRLWRQGRGRCLVMTGAVDPNGVSEPEAMRRLAVEAGVPGDAIVLDEEGLNTWRSATAVAELMDRRGWRTSLSVSHYYHLLRIQVSARRAGLVTYTVPARMTRRLVREPFYVLRECAAFYGYCFLKAGRPARR